MSKEKEKTTYSFSGDLKVQTSKAFLVNLDTPEKYKGDETWIPKSKIIGDPYLLDLDIESEFTDKSGVPSFKYKSGKINGVCEAWVISSKHKKEEKEAKSKEKVEQPKEEIKSESKAGAPSVVNVNLDTSSLVVMLKLITEQISDLSSQIIEVKELLKPKKSTKAKPKIEADK